MSLKVSSLYAEIGADTTGFEKGSRKVKGGLNDMSGDMQKMSKTGQSAFSRIGGSLTELHSAIGLAGAAMQTMKKGYEFAKQGAQLEFLQGKFDNLSASIGTTSAALMGDLRTATKGTLSDMELMASVTDLVGLGLANSHDEAVRLATVSAGLGMNMNQLVLTLTNMTTMRFDALGVRVDGFKEKVKALEEQGYSADKAFKEAFLQQAEAQLLTVGNAADSAAGSFMKLEAAGKNISDSFKQMAGEALADDIGRLAWQLDHMKDIAISMLALRKGGAGGKFFGLLDMQDLQIAAEARVEMLEQRAALENLKDEWPGVTRAIDDNTASLVDAEAAAKAHADRIKAMSDENKTYLSNFEKVKDMQDKYNDGLAEADAQLKAGKMTAKEHAAAVAELQATYDEATKGIILNLLEMKLTADGVFDDADLQTYLNAMDKLGMDTGLARSVLSGLNADVEELTATMHPGVKAFEAMGKKVGDLTQKEINLLGRTEDATTAFADMNEGIDNTAESFAEAHGPLSAVTQDLGGLPKSGTVWNYLVNITTNGKVPKIAPGSSTCFIAGTLVTMADGSTKAIEQVQPGERVLSYDPARRVHIAATVQDVFRHASEDMTGEYYLLVNSIGVTANHLMYANGEWTPAGELQIGDTLLDADGEPVAVETIARVGARVRTYNLHTNHDTHNYFAGGVLVHNAKTQNMAAGGTLNPSAYTIVGEGATGWSPTAEVIVGNKVIPHHAAQWMKEAGLLDGAKAMAFGGDIESPWTIGGGTHSSGGTTGGRTPPSPSTRIPRSPGRTTGGTYSSGGLTTQDVEVVASDVANMAAPVIQSAMDDAITQMASVVQQQNEAAARNIVYLAQVVERLDTLINITPSEHGIARSTFEGASKYS